jgi:hypothetical protein
MFTIPIYMGAFTILGGKGAKGPAVSMDRVGQMLIHGIHSSGQFRKLILSMARIKMSFLKFE